MSVDIRAGTPAALLIARWWSRPTLEELGSWSGLWAEGHRVAGELMLEPDAVEQLRLAAEGSHPEPLLDEYERLFVGPGRAPCAPYESLWRADVPDFEQGTLMGSASDHVEGVYRDLGVQIRLEAHELPDHLLVEWEGLAYALHHGAMAQAQALLADHLSRWMTPFCHAVAHETNEAFYATLAELTPAWTSALSR